MDKSHFNTFIFSNANKIYYYVFCILKNYEQTIQIVGKTFEECWHKRKVLSHSDLTPVFKIARDLAKNEVTSKSASGRVPSQNDEVNPMLIRFCKLLEGLAPIQAEIFCLRSLLRMSIDDISKIVGLGINNIQSMLAEARKLIRVQVDPEGILKESSCHELLTKYYAGSTSIEEEEQLRLYVSRMDLSEIPETDRELFGMFLKIGNAEIPISDSEILSNKIKELQTTKWGKIVAKFKK
ncbi:sigma factor-like helix-turn-helix DNA-binding protein [Marinifilum fragile]|uniref:RNA polymerase sigma factor n=1 Tax=Marinifilum fragile TaxID=570161 RepID=UPI002AA7E3D8|nr:sigma factor-like helix-turn-helix DNA-binding protein [Marinifilum fragile]